MNAVTINGISKSFATKSGPLPVLASVNAEVKQGQIVALIGPSGCGKSTLLRIISGLENNFQGEVLRAGIARQSFIPQRPALLPWKSVLENVRFPLEAASFNMASQQGNVMAMLELTGLTEFASFLPGQLSGGMAQRASLARALVTAPHLLLMDEPFSALDERTRQKLNSVTLQLARKFKLTAIMVTHSVMEAVAISDRVLIMSLRPGEIIADIPVVVPEENGIRDMCSGAFFSKVKEVQQCLV